MNRHLRSAGSAITRTEWLVVITVSAILASLLLPALAGARRKAGQLTRSINLKLVKTTCE